MAKPPREFDKADLLKRASALKAPTNNGNFATGWDSAKEKAPESGVPASEYKVCDDDELRHLLVASGGAVVAQERKGLRKRAWIIRLYPNFDAPKAVPTTRTKRATGSTRSISGVLEIPRGALPLNHGEVSRYIQAVTLTARQAFEERRQNGLTEAEVTRAIKGLKGTALINKMREIDRENAMTFEEYIKGQFPSEYVEILGFPDTGPDTPDAKR